MGAMITFLPLRNFEESFKVLDYKRLGNQRNEARLLLKTLSGEDSRWKNHVSVKMWKGYENTLTHYYNLCVKEWKNRGYKNTMPLLQIPKSDEFMKIPNWLDDERLFSSHRAALLYKNYNHYKQFGWKENPEINYWWPNND